MSQPVIMPPGPFGGNMDTRHLTKGSILHLPVQHAGALFSCGEAHAAQGDGEVCLTGIESPVYAALRFNPTVPSRPRWSQSTWGAWRRPRRSSAR
jgi:acetamidase/formamidase